MAVELQDRSTGEPSHVIIVGAGLAGLCTAFELESKGLSCTILEADPTHVGGRVRTHRFANGLYGELGAMRIPDKHLIVRGYTEKFGLKTRPFFNSHPNAYFHLRGRTERRLRIDRIRDLFALRPWESDRTLMELWLHAISPIVGGLTETERADLLGSQSWKTRKIHDLDHRSLHQVLERAGLSPDGIEFLAVAWGLGETLLGSAFTEHLREEVEEVWEHDFVEIVGGMERLPLAFQNQLRDKPNMGCEVVRFEQDNARGRVAAVYRKAGAEARLEADYLVCTIPFSVLQRVDTVPAFSAGKQRAIRQIFYESATKVLLQTRRRFWETDDAIFGGASYTDLLTGPIFYPSDNRLDPDEDRAKGPGVLVAGYNWGEAARRLGCLPASEREQLAIKLVSRVHPQLTAEAGIIEDKLSWAWHSHKWSCGAFAFYQPGQFARLQRDVIAPEGRIHFAGEHASRSHTWMEGALDSARRAAGEIMERAGQA
jgi:monoamine oxidase